MKTIKIVKPPYSVLVGDHHIFLTTDEEGANEARVNIQIKSVKREGSDELHYTGIDITHPWICLPVQVVLRWDGDFQVGTLTYSD